MRKKFLILPFFLVLTFMLVNVGYAQEDVVDLLNFPEQLGDHFNISTFQAGILCSCIVMLSFLLPVAIWSKNFVVSIFMGLVSVGFCVALGWLPYWFLLILSMLVALMFSGKMRDWVSKG